MKKEIKFTLKEIKEAIRRAMEYDRSIDKELSFDNLQMKIADGARNNFIIDFLEFLYGVK